QQEPRLKPQNQLKHQQQQLLKNAATILNAKFALIIRFVTNIRTQILASLLDDGYFELLMLKMCYSIYLPVL
ncbi:hypothetical protein Mgra_00005571, partial [Meloidogyne graminicola]